MDNTTVVSYINKQGGTHSLSLLCLVVDLFCVATSSDHSSQSQTHSRLFEHDSEPPIKAQLANNERVESPFQNCDSDIQGLGHSDSGHVHHSPQFRPSSVHVSNSGATSTGGRCSVSGLAGEVNVHVSAVSLAQQSHSEKQEAHAGSRDRSCSLGSPQTSKEWRQAQFIISESRFTCS